MNYQVGCSTQSRGQGSREQERSGEPQREPLPIKNILTKGDTVKAGVFSVYPTWFLFNQITDTSDPEVLFKLF